MAAKAAAGAPTTIGNKYDVLEKIAEGGAGTVYKCRERATGDVVAIKVVTPGSDAGPNDKGTILLKRFEQEILAANKLHHPNLVRGLGYGQDGDALYLVMEYVDGESLWQRVQRLGRLPEAEAVDIIVQVGQALHRAHQKNIIHRDVKPENILVTADVRAKLTDLGLAKNTESSMDLTRPATGLGTPYYMAPEQFSDAKNAGVRCDVYSLAATLYMAVTGEIPFEARGLMGILKKKLANDITPPRQLVPSLSQHVDWAIRRSLRASPEQRHPSCLDFVQELLGAGPGDPSAPKAPKPVASQPPGSERRAAIRFASTVKGSCQLINSEEECWPAKVLDISATGFGMILGRRFEPGTLLSVELQGTGAWQTRTLIARVVRVKTQPGRKWLIGCLFKSPLSEDELEALV